MLVRHTADIRNRLADDWFDGHMSVPAAVHRSEARESHYLFRMSKTDKARLKQRAFEAGMSIQAYLEHTALGYERPIERSSGRPRKQHESQEELDISA